MNEALAYSIHLGSDKNRTLKAKEIAKNNPSETTSFSNNAIQNKAGLSKANKHNLRDYNNRRDLIRVVYGTNNLYNDVQRLYFQEFEQSRLEYNAKQTREDRKIKNYFNHISDSKLWDLACEFIIELGDMDYWNDKDMNYRLKMVDVYKEQVEDLMKVVPQFKVANAVIHFDETSPHMHLIGLPISDNNKRGMKKQVAKSKIFTKESLTRIQDEMRKRCIKSFNKYYEQTAELKKKQKGRNQDISVKDMNGYKDFKKQLKKNEQRLAKANLQTENLDNASKDITKIIDNLKPTLMNKNNMVISSENVQRIKNFTKDVKDTNKTIRSVKDLELAIKDFEYSTNEIERENRSLKYQLEQKDDEINELKCTIKEKDEEINELNADKEELKGQLHKFKEFWRSLLKRFQEMIGFHNDEKYKYVSDDLYKNGIFDDNDNEIVNDLDRKVKTKEEIKEDKIKKKKYERF